tara:strand:+ start:321 stop:761 length:441 start_codon:yes stop_codon:yes gene_type:complete
MIFTFRTAFCKKDLKKIDKNTFVFGKLKQDFAKFSLKIIKENPSLIIGVANSGSNTRLESKAINQYNKTKSISKNGEKEYGLFTPHSPPFTVSRKATDSFCNWTCYQISKLINENNLKTKLVFIHLNMQDFGTFKKFIAELLISSQ